MTAVESTASDEPTPPGVRTTDGQTTTAVCAAVCFLVTDEGGRILLDALNHRAGVIGPGETPTSAVSRKTASELGLAVPSPRGLAVDWIPAAPGRPAEIVYVYDGGTLTPAQIRAILSREQELRGPQFIEPAALSEYMTPGDARRALAALRARINGGGPTLLEDGRPTDPTVLDELEVLRTARKAQSWPWHAEPVTPGLRVKQSWGWCFSPAGRVLVLIGEDTGSACLPGGSTALTGPAPDRPETPAETLHREAWEEARVRLREPLHLGYLYDQYDNAGPCARVRMAAMLTSVGPVTEDEATGQTYARILATPEQVIQLFDWGREGPRQLEAVHAARELLGLPRAGRQPVTQLPVEGGVS
ncbi:NUDIX hydrolase [Streptomyces scopuliridis]|uniref:NUDIX hydrolase n=1 Tax=Streptomyces scopuliridis TaxID=452529 RepID=A0ACD4ZUR8_9ACTN|nr:NUDIX hydrolase [Streptomyces scopuliridis]WSC01689.1 NUDIX hydrolase [Streptomyces scopuliridis]WSC04772.1 NUDIX hydrolase [Streptomyces scopuliridis]